MDLSNALKQINTNTNLTAPRLTVVKSLPANAVQEAIHGACTQDMHYDDLFKAIGKLATSGIDHDTLVQNAAFFEQFISSDSDTIKEKTIIGVINEHRKAYSHQVGSHPTADQLKTCFNSKVYELLPEKLRNVCLLIDDAVKRDVCLIGLITGLSAAFSRHRFTHGAGNDIKEYSPHILSLVAGQAGGGKGMTRYAEVIVDAISRKAMAMKEETMKAYRREKADYEREKRRREKDKESLDGLDEPDKPIKYCFAMSASDTTQAALVEILKHNPAGGFAYDSEVDTLVQGNAKRDFGGFSDVIRKVFHHESLSRQRKGEGESYIVTKPRLALMLSGTHDQLKKLIPSEYNGLFSRLWYYIIPPAHSPYLMPTAQEDIVGEACERLQDEVLQNANLWGNTTVRFIFSNAQEQELFVEMQDKKAAEDKHGGDIGASWLRMGLITKRIAVTLAAFEGGGGPELPDNCWQAALALLPTLKAHCLRALDIVRSNQGKIDISKQGYEALKAANMTDEMIAKELGVSSKTLQRRKKDWTN